MANALYPKWKQALMLEGEHNTGLDQTDAANAAYVALVTIGSSGYVYSAAHQFFTDLNSIVGTPQQVIAPVIGAVAIFHASAVVFVNVTGGETDAIVIYRSNSSFNSTWRLVMYEDTGIVGFPITPNGGNIIVTWNTQGIFQL
jgi:hypothetical protein